MGQKRTFDPIKIYRTIGYYEVLPYSYYLIFHCFSPRKRIRYFSYDKKLDVIVLFSHATSCSRILRISRITYVNKKIKNKINSLIPRAAAILRVTKHLELEFQSWFIPCGNDKSINQITWNLKKHKENFCLLRFLRFSMTEAMACRTHTILFYFSIVVLFVLVLWHENDGFGKSESRSKIFHLEYDALLVVLLFVSADNTFSHSLGGRRLDSLVI